jgi:hypothetical protein
VAFAGVLVALGLAFACAYAGASGFAGAFAVAVAVGGAVAGSFAGAGASGVAGATAVATAIGAAVAQGWIGARTRRPASTLGLYAALLLIALIAVVVATPAWRPGVLGERDVTVILFFGFLPLLNAAADFASTGLTRWWLRQGVRAGLIRHAVWDALAAVGIFLLMGFAIIAVVHWVRPQDGRALANLSGLFADLHGPEAHNYFWLYFCLFSTLLPTALHGVVACFALFTLASKRLGQPIAAGLGSGDRPTAERAEAALAFCAALAVVVPAFLIWAALRWFGRPILDAALWVFEGFARLIGAI